jgi:hypothetical protein
MAASVGAAMKDDERIIVDRDNDGQDTNVPPGCHHSFFPLCMIAISNPLNTQIELTH